MPKKIADTHTKVKYRTNQKSPKNPSLYSGVRWYEANKKDLAGEVFARVENIKQRQLLRRFELAIFQALYTNFNTANWVGGLFSNANMPSHLTNRMSINVVKQCIDTATARIAKSKPRIFVLPSEGDTRVVRKAINLTAFLDGAMEAANIYPQSELQFRDSGIYGTGALIIRFQDNEFCVEQIKVDELIIDNIDGMYDQPQEFHYDHVYARSVIEAMYPDKIDQIATARNTWRGGMAFLSDFDRVQVIESWRLPSSPTSKDGRHCVCIGNATLFDETWEDCWVPIERFHWTDPTYSCFGQGIAQELQGLQASITEMIRNIDKSVHLYAVPRIFVDGTVGLSQHHFNNDISVIKCNGPPGQAVSFLTPQAMSSDIYSYIQWKKSEAFAQIGLSQMSATSEKPAGLNAAVAMRTYQDIETERFAIVAQKWERMYVSIGKKFVAIAAKEYKKDPKLSVKVPGRSFMKRINWKDADLKEDMYVMKAYPTNLLSNTPEGRLQQVTEMIQSGMMPKDVALQQLRVPTLNGWIDDETAARENVEMCIDSILDKGKFIDPSPISDIDLAVSKSQSAYLRAQYNDVEPKKQDMLLRFLNRALELQAAKQQAQASMANPQGNQNPVVGQSAAPPVAPMAAQGSGPIPMATA